MSEKGRYQAKLDVLKKENQINQQSQDAVYKE